MQEIILISFLGPDQPNQFTRLMQVLSSHSLQILDVGQAVIHNQLTLASWLHLKIRPQLLWQ
jgi:phosphoserine phosphatase